MWNDCSDSDYSTPIPSFRNRNSSDKENFDLLMLKK
mgnify:FL=1